MFAYKGSIGPDDLTGKDRLRCIAALRELEECGCTGYEFVKPQNGHCAGEIIRCLTCVKEGKDPHQLCKRGSSNGAITTLKGPFQVGKITKMPQPGESGSTQPGHHYCAHLREKKMSKASQKAAKKDKEREMCAKQTAAFMLSLPPLSPEDAAKAKIFGKPISTLIKLKSTYEDPAQCPGLCDEDRITHLELVMTSITAWEVNYPMLLVTAVTCPLPIRKKLKSAFKSSKARLPHWLRAVLQGRSPCKRSWA